MCVVPCNPIPRVDLCDHHHQNTEPFPPCEALTCYAFTDSLPWQTHILSPSLSFGYSKNDTNGIKQSIEIGFSDWFLLLSMIPLRALQVAAYVDNSLCHWPVSCDVDVPQFVYPFAHQRSSESFLVWNYDGYSC